MVDPKLILSHNKRVELENYLLKVASKAPLAEKNPFLGLEMEPKIFNKPIPASLKSKMSLEKCLKWLSESGKMIDISGKNIGAEIYDPKLLLESIGKNFKSLPCILNERYLIVDFNKLTNEHKEPLGIRIFTIKDYDQKQQKNDMVRRSED